MKGIIVSAFLLFYFESASAADGCESLAAKFPNIAIKEAASLGGDWKLNLTGLSISDAESFLQSIPDEVAEIKVSELSDTARELEVSFTDFLTDTGSASSDSVCSLITKLFSKD